MIPLISLLLLSQARAGGPPLLLQKPTVSADSIVFAFADDLWIVARSGGDARRLTTGVGIETDPHFSPDGKSVLFTGQYDGNMDLFTVPAAGGVPKRLTWHPSEDQAVGWSPDGAQALFRSYRATAHGMPRLYTVPASGGVARALPLPIASDGTFSPDGKRIAYVPIAPWHDAWKRYRGGQTTPIWIADLATSHIDARVPRDNTNDSYPMWVGDRVYFLSDRAGAVTLFRYETGSGKVSQAVQNDGLDLKAASAGPGAIVYERFGEIFLFDLAQQKAQKVDIRVAGDLQQVRPRRVKVAGQIGGAGISPSGARAVFSARGDIFTVPAEKGDVRNLTQTSGVHERDPAWSPDGKRIAYFSDASGEYALHVRSHDGAGDVQKIALGSAPSIYYGLIWSPDSKKLAFGDVHLNLWYVDLEKGAPVKVDTNPKPLFRFDPAWSPDSRWLAYARQLKSYHGAIFAHALESGKTLQLTDGLSDARSAVFDAGGRYLYFTASTDLGLGLWFAPMSSIDRPISRSVYVMVLRKGQPSPLAPESDEEKEKAAAPTDAKPDTTVIIDGEGLSQRILDLPIPARNYTQLAAAKAGVLYLVESPIVRQGPRTLHRYDLNARKLEQAVAGIGSVVVAASGEKLLWQQGARWGIAATSGPIAPGAGALDLSAMEAAVDPRAEWRQMFDETLRSVREEFYDPNLHGVKLAALRERYAPYLEGLGSREDLNYLLREMLGELTVSHVSAGGGDAPSPAAVPVGLLGADYAVEGGRYRFERIFDGENWNPGLRAPLTQPGQEVRVGEYLLAVNGREVRADANEELYAAFEATAGKRTALRVGPTPDGVGARDVVVVPGGDEGSLRYRAWIEDNRRKVDQLTGGRVAYVHMPDTAQGGFASFTRYFFAQVGKEATIVDERFNGGGLLADFVIDHLRRPLAAYFTHQSGEDFAVPTAAIFGPKAMLINEFAGSGGDYMPWAFRDAKLGPLIGKRTWGGLVGASGTGLIDGGFAGAPRSGMWNPNGTWDVENWGVAPDIEVELDPEAWRAGRDPQLEKAVEVILEALRRNPAPRPQRPTFPNYHNGKPVPSRRPGDSGRG